MTIQHCRFHMVITLIAITLWGCYPDKRTIPPVPDDMVKELASLYESEVFQKNFTRSDLGVLFFSELIGQGDLSKLEEGGYRLGLADQLIATNNIDSGIAIYKALLHEIENAAYFSGAVKYEAEQLVLAGLAVAYLRRGELNNCQLNHHQTSCIIPFTSNALHINPEDSYAAFRTILKYLSINPKKSGMIWLLNIAALTINMPSDSIPTPYRINFEKYNSTVVNFPKFKDVAAISNSNRFGHFGGVCVEDFNNDGLADIFSTSTPLNENVELLLQDYSGGFVNTTHKAGLLGITGGGNVMHADYNNDGLMDVFITRGGWLGKGGFQPNSLLKNIGDGRFEDVTITSGLFNYKITHTACWGDFNNDGWLDLFVGSENQAIDNDEVMRNCESELYINNKDGTFTNVSKLCGIEISAWVKGAIWLDYNNDGWQDLYVSVYGGKNYLFKNNGTNNNGHCSFTDVAEKAGVQEPIWSFPVAAFDINQDGWEDIFINGFKIEDVRLADEYRNLIPPESPVKIFINQKNGTFKEMAKDFGLDRSIYAMALNYADLDLDGYPDLYLGTGFADLAALYPNIMLHNDKGVAFKDVTTQSGAGHLQKGHGIAIGDIDNDGDNDIYAQFGGFLSGDGFWNALFENSGNSNNWISLRLVGSASNKSSIGARIKVNYVEGGLSKTVFCTISTGGSFGSSTLEKLIGIGKAERIESVEVMWPRTTNYQSYNIEEMNKRYLITEGETEHPVVKRENQKTTLSKNYQQHLHR